MFPFAAMRGRATNSWLAWIHRNFHRRRRRSVGVGVRTYSPPCRAPLCSALPLGVRYIAPFSHSTLDPQTPDGKIIHRPFESRATDRWLAGRTRAGGRAGRRADVAVCRLKRNAYSLWRRTPTDKSANEALRSYGRRSDPRCNQVGELSVKGQCNFGESRIITRPSSRNAVPVVAQPLARIMRLAHYIMPL